jgi:hypothetical protein
MTLSNQKKNNPFHTIQQSTSASILLQSLPKLSLKDFKKTQSRQALYYETLSTYFMAKGTLIKELRFQNCTILNSIANKTAMLPLI